MHSFFVFLLNNLFITGSEGSGLVLQTIVVYDKSIKKHFGDDTRTRTFLKKVIKITGDRLLELSPPVWLDVTGLEYIDETIVPSDKWVDTLENTQPEGLRSTFCLEQSDDAIGKASHYYDMCEPRAKNIVSSNGSIASVAAIFAHELGHGLGMR